MPLQWANCPVCGTGHSTLDPLAPCSAQCSGELRRRAAMGKSVPDAEPKYRRADDRRGASKGPGPVPKGKKSCLVMTIALAGGSAALLAATAELVRQVIA